MPALIACEVAIDIAAEIWSKFDTPARQTRL